MRLSGKMCFKIILKVTKNQGFNLCLEDTIFEKPQGGSPGYDLCLSPLQTQTLKKKTGYTKHPKA